MPRTDKYTGRLRVPGELSVTNVVNYGFTGTTKQLKSRVLTGHTTLTSADDGAFVVLNNATNILHVNLPLVNTCNGTRWTFYNATANGFKVIADTNAIMTPIGVNAADKIKILYSNHTVNFGQCFDIFSTSSTHYVLPRPTMTANVGLGLLQG